MTDMPTWEGFNVPILKVLSDGATRTLRQLRLDVADAVGLSPEHRAAALPSGQGRADNRIGWAASPSSARPRSMAGSNSRRLVRRI